MGGAGCRPGRISGQHHDERSSRDSASAAGAGYLHASRAFAEAASGCERLFHSLPVRISITAKSCTAYKKIKVPPISGIPGSSYTWFSGPLSPADGDRRFKRRSPDVAFPLTSIRRLKIDCGRRGRFHEDLPPRVGAPRRNRRICGVRGQHQRNASNGEEIGRHRWELYRTRSGNSEKRKPGSWRWAAPKPWRRNTNAER